MQLTLFCVGRLKAGPERELFERYFDRAAKLGPQLGFQKPRLTEIAESRGQSAAQRKAEEANTLRNAIKTKGTKLVLFDERAKSLTSPDFSERICDWRDAGCPDTVFAIGGPDGFDQSLRQDADLSLSFGALTMPHQIVRILVAEQIYRAMTIAANHPYHRD